jgi:hypothetical protein
MEQEKQQKVALFRFAVLGDVLQRELKYGELKQVLKMLSQKEWIDPNGQARRLSWKTLEEWYYQYKKLGFDGPAKGKIERFWRTLRAQVLDRLDSNKVKTLNVRLNAWVHGEYNRSPRSSLAGKTPLESWQEDLNEIAWIEEPSIVEKALASKLERSVKNDSTCSIHGQCYEVPTHFRGRKIPIYYSSLRPEQFWIEDGVTKVVLKAVDLVLEKPKRKLKLKAAKRAAC